MSRSKLFFHSEPSVQGSGTTRGLVTKSKLSPSNSTASSQLNSAHKCVNILSNFNSCLCMVFKQVHVVNFDLSWGSFPISHWLHAYTSFSCSSTRLEHEIWFDLYSQKKYMTESNLFIIYTFCYALYFIVSILMLIFHVSFFFLKMFKKRY